MDDVTLIRFVSGMLVLAFIVVIISVMKNKRNSALRFKNPSNGYIEESTAPGLWCLLFGCFYFAAKGVWRHFVIGFALGLFTLGLSWLVYPFFARDIIRQEYMRRGWVEVIQQPQAIAPTPAPAVLCSTCGKYSAGGAAFCSVCGQPMPSPTVAS